MRQADAAPRHSVGLGRCSPCGGWLGRCPGCGQLTLHHIGYGRGDGLEVACEKGCSPTESIQLAWKAEMKEALYQLELREADKR